MQPDVPLVSVIMPSYNSAASLGVAVDSVLNQSIPDIELIIVDDASTDTTARVVAAMAETDKRIVFLRQPCNSGPAAARNIGLAAARGVWIAPIDADDEISYDRLRALVEAGEAQCADIIADGVLFIGPGSHGRPFELRPVRVAAEKMKELSIHALIRSDIPLNGHCSMGYLKPLMRRDFMQRFDLHYDETLRFAEDFNLYARALLCGARFLLHPESHYRYNQTPLSASRSDDALPELARFALLSNQRLSDLHDIRCWPGLESLLISHRLRWSTVLWFNHLRRALCARNIRAATNLLVQCPGGWLNIVLFAKDRIRASSQHIKLKPSQCAIIGKSLECR